MKTAAVLVVATVLVAGLGVAPSSLANPVSHFPEHVDPVAQDAVQLVPRAYTEERADRHARFTCDVLSFSSKWVTPNHSACAAHCIAMRKGYKGGRCENAVCHCRK